MSDAHVMPAAEGDLVVVAVSGVQRFIAESRTTSDLASASEIVASLVHAAAQACSGSGGRLVFPAAADPVDQGDATGEGGMEVAGLPNRVVALVANGSGPAVGRTIADAVRRHWLGLLEEVFSDPLPATPGMPDLQWVSVPASAGNYRRQWDLARRALEARRRVRDFPAVDIRGRSLCSLSPRWPEADVPDGARKHHRNERLAAANWVKRQGRYRDDAQHSGFPSTYSIASAGYRRAVLARLDEQPVADAVRALRAVAVQVSRSQEIPVPGLVAESDSLVSWLVRSGGAWVYPERWTAQALSSEYGDRHRDLDFNKIAAQGSRAAKKLMEVAGFEPAIYLAVLVQDLDGMGRFLGGEPANGRGGHTIAVDPESHRSVSARLRGLARDQVHALCSPEVMGVPIYAGGDDLLAFVPASTALAAARAVHGSVPSDLPTASTAVVFFHQRTSLRRAIETARELLEQAKGAEHGKHGLAVGYLRRSGVWAASIQPWVPDDGTASPAELWEMLGGDQEYDLSPRLIADLERDEVELADLAGASDRWDYYGAEIRRLVRRHLGGPDDEAGQARGAAIASALVGLGARERFGDGRSPRPLPAARVGVFMRQEAR